MILDKIDKFCEFISKNKQITKVYIDPLKLKEHLLKTNEDYLLKDFNSNNLSKEKFNQIYKDIFLLKTILTDTNLFSKNSISNVKNNLFRSWILNEFGFVFNSIKELDETKGWIWNGYEKSIRKMYDFNITNIENFIFCVYSNFKNNFNEIKNNLFEPLFSFLKFDPNNFPFIVFSELTPPFFSSIENFDDLPNKILISETLGNYDKELNLITIHNPGIHWFSEYFHLEYDDVKVFILNYLIIKNFYKSEFINSNNIENITYFLLKRLFYSQEISTEVLDHISLIEFENFRGEKLNIEISDSEVNKFDELLKGVSRIDLDYYSHKFFEEAQDKDVKNYLIYEKLKPIITYDGEVLRKKLESRLHISNQEECISDIHNEILGFFKQECDINKTRIKKLNVNPEIKQLLEKNIGIISKKDFFNLFEQSHLKYLLFYNLIKKIREKEVILDNNKYKYNFYSPPLGPSILFKKLNKKYIETTILTNILDKKFPRKQKCYILTDNVFKQLEEDLKPEIIESLEKFKNKQFNENELKKILTDLNLNEDQKKIIRKSSVNYIQKNEDSLDEESENGSKQFKDDEAQNFVDDLEIEENINNVLQIFYEKFVTEENIVGNTRKICLLFLYKIIEMEKNKVAKSIVIDNTQISELLRLFEYDVIFLFKNELKEFTQLLINESGFPSQENLEEIISQFINNTLTSQIPIKKLEAEFLKLLKEHKISIDNLKESHLKSIIEALFKFKVKNFYEDFSKEYKIEYSLLNKFIENFVWKIVDYKIKGKIPNKKQLIEDICKFGKENKISSLEKFSFENYKNLSDNIDKFKDKMKIFIPFLSDLTFKNYSDFIKSSGDEIISNLFPVKEIFLDEIMDRKKENNFQLYSESEKAKILFSFFINLKIEKFIPKPNMEKVFFYITDIPNLKTRKMFTYDIQTTELFIKDIKELT